MKPFILKWDTIQEKLTGDFPEFPKYTTQIMNLANQNAQGTRPRVVGQMSDLITQFEGTAYSEWADWYNSTYPKAIEEATTRVVAMIEKLQDAILTIDRAMVREWITDLVLSKTFIGFRFQQTILRELGARLNRRVKDSSPSEESHGIDGYVGGTPVSIKPSTYKGKKALAEKIEVPMVFYEKMKAGVRIDPTELYLSKDSDSCR